MAAPAYAGATNRDNDMALSGISRNKKALAATVLALVLALGVLGAVKARAPEGRSMSGDFPVFDVRHGPLTISVNVSGTIKAREQEVIKCEVEGQTTILSIVPEGNEIKKGDLLIQLDASRLQDEKVDQEIRVQNAEAAFIGAREKLEVTKNQAESDVDKAKLLFQFAEEDLKNFMDGEFPKQLKEAGARITLAQGVAARAKEKLTGSVRLAEKNFITSSELEADKHEDLKAQLDLELSEDDKRLLTDFTYKRELAQLESDVRQARMALERTERKASADIVQAEAELKAKDSEFNRQKDKLEKNKQQIEKTTLYAPADGLVVYATSGQGGGRGNTEPLADGQVVRERQELIHLPTGSSFMAEVDVHESSLTKIQPNLPVHITVDALPGRSFRGHVVSVAPLPDARSAWLNPDLKVYNTDIYIEGEATGLRTGMTCLAEIIVEVYDDAVYVPVQAVVRVGGRPTVYVADGNKTEAREVALGLDNNRMVRIAKGLTPGERVLLAPPLSMDKQEDAEEEEQPEALTTAPASAGVTPESAPSPKEGAEKSTPDANQVGGDRGETRVGDMRERFRNASPEERERMRKEMEERMKDLTPEQREQIMRQRGRGSGGASGANGENR